MLKPKQGTLIIPNDKPENAFVFRGGIPFKASVKYREATESETRKFLLKITKPTKK